LSEKYKLISARLKAEENAIMELVGLSNHSREQVWRLPETNGKHN
jgi:hypothetical protein